MAGHEHKKAYTAHKGHTYLEALGEKPSDSIIAVKSGNRLFDLRQTADSDTEIQAVYLDSDDGLKILRHSAAHLLAHAITSLFPDSKPNAGPPTEDGFYYDFDMNPISSDQFPAIEEKMQEVVKKNYPIVREEHDRKELLSMFSANPYKIDKIKDNVPEGGRSSIYRQGDFYDFCTGPHVPSTGYLKAVRIISLASTHYRGDEKNPAMVRIYGTAFPDEKSLKKYLQNREEALKRDHRKLGTEMDLFVFNTERAPGFPLYTPNGSIIRSELMSFMKEKNSQRGWQEVWTPHIFRDVIWKQSGHYAKYKPNMYVFTLEDGDSYGVKPMNCPGHISIFEREPHSYRDLPIRLSEPGTVYRYEKSGEVGGLTRPRAFTIDDGHAFMRFDQIVDEITSILEMIKETFNGILGEVDLKFDLSVMDKEHPENYLLVYRCRNCGSTIEARKASMEEHLLCPSCGSENLEPDFTVWDGATEQLREALDREKLEYQEYPGEAAFYGPKIDVHVRDAIGRMWQLSTVQLDFFMPTNFGLSYVNSESKPERIVMVHRAIFGSYERFMAIVLEHFAGKLPTWLSPIQAYVIPVSENYDEYAKKVQSRIQGEGIRAGLDTSSETLGKKIKTIRGKRPAYIVVVGQKEMETGTVTARNRKDQQKSMELNEFVRDLGKEISGRNIDQFF